MGDRGTEIGAFFAFVASLRANWLVDGRRGASDDEIAQYTRLGRHPLPPLYAAFLREFGAQPAGLGFRGDGSPVLERLIDELTDDPGRTPLDCVLISAGAIDDVREVLHYGADDDPAPAVAELTSTFHQHALAPVSPSFAHHLYRHTWLRALPGPVRWQTVPNAGAAAEVEKYARAIGFDAHWFGVAGQRCLDAGDAQLTITPEATSVRIELYSRVIGACEKYAHAFSAKVGATPLRS